MVLRHRGFEIEITPDTLYIAPVLLHGSTHAIYTQLQELDPMVAQDLLVIRLRHQKLFNYVLKIFEP